MRLESLAGRHVGVLLPFPVHHDEAGRGLLLDPLPLLATLGERAQRGDDPASLAAAFHESVAAGTTALVRTVAGWTGLQTVCLGGGSFQNARLLETVRSHLEALGMRVLWPRLLPPNDGGLSYVRVLEQRALHLRRVHVEPTRDDQITAAPDQGEVVEV